MKRRRDSKPKTPRSKKPLAPGSVARSAGATLRSYTVGALPILNRFIARMKLEEFLRQFVFQDKRCTISPVVGVLLLVRNYLVSRQPIYGVGEWARQYVPNLLGILGLKTSGVSDDRVGRCLDRLFAADCPSLVLAVTRHVVEEFGVDLSELHNDSTTITFSGAYESAGQETRAFDKKVPAITWGHNKDHRPDLKQLLYNLTVSSDGAVPVSFGVENGNLTDDQTHKANWDFLCLVVGSPNFIYVADSKLATHANMTYIANRGGRFISVLPQTRSEDKAFRLRVLQGGVCWEEIERKYNDAGEVVDVVSTAQEVGTTSEGFRLFWYLSTRKVELDRAARANTIRRGFANLTVLRLKLRSPRTRYQEKSQVEKAVAKCLADSGATEWITVEIRPEEREVFIQESPGRPSPKTKYRKEVRTRFSITFDVNRERVEEAERLDGIFPLVTNDRDLSVKEVLATYKRQPAIEKRFSQLKTQFEVAPIFLKSAHRVVALLSVYYLALLLQALVEREIRCAMKSAGIVSLPLYHEERVCKAPCTRRLIDLFENIQLHELRSSEGGPEQRFATELTDLQRQVIRLLGVPETDFQA
jgi:hypothetical protein